MNKKQIIMDGAFKFVDLNRTYSIEEFAAIILEKIGGVNNLEALSYAEKFQKSIANNLKELNDSLVRKGLTPIGIFLPGNRISWNSSNENYLQVWKLRPILLDFIESLNDDDFECICCCAITQLGGSAWKTKSRGDGNVDLYGLLTSRTDNHVFGKSNKLKIVGQCKNYGHKEEITKFESFHQALSNVKFRAQRVINEVPAEFLRERGVIIGWYVCRDGFQGGVYKDAQQHGVILSDKYDLVEILSKIEFQGLSRIETKVKLNLLNLMRKYR